MTTDNTAIDLTRRESFDAFTPVTIRFSDQDSMGHVNNVSFAQYVEAARTMLIQGLLDRFDHAGLDLSLPASSSTISANYTTLVRSMSAGD